MLINKDTLSEILKLEDLDEIFNKTFDLLGPFLGKYKVQELESIYNTPEEDQFRLDAKTIFSLLHHVFSNEILDDSDESEKETFDALTFHLKNIISKIDGIDLKNPEKEFEESMLYISKHFEDQFKELENINESMDKLSANIDNLSDSLTLNSKVNKTQTILKSKTLTEDDLDFIKETLVFFKDYIKNKDKEFVISVIKNVKDPSGVDNFELAKNLRNELEEIYKSGVKDSPEELKLRERVKEVSEILSIETLMSLIGIIEQRVNGKKLL